ncbi:MAG TPA: DNA-directed RNA polymerase subunit omega [Firmicutes bacterium]|uniref:DNA-directed RNA polymerase subunit omega n=1 Tax=Capillibacterium thermochitinicola TaxID=2699427 RepID=A0A8J6HXY6_9FIRM|nr:DNA-directed RNA polymerase subunit omega [Capillibacterium thermochitinicola]MBA2133557.1 DNA-directed RNA polymerase subunit omega [Capillibacterium thermochitinicola]HHW12345.1 DNA-directed RNA polymerase subunit omega [Bacillota bacterium]
MITPSLEELLARVDNRYTLVVTAAKRARQLINESGPNKDGTIGAVSTALEEILQGKIVPVQKPYSSV